jgi:hypothetical protein
MEIPMNAEIEYSDSPFEISEKDVKELLASLRGKLPLTGLWKRFAFKGSVVGLNDSFQLTGLYVRHTKLKMQVRDLVIIQTVKKNGLLNHELLWPKNAVLKMGDIA